ncbi:M56 family metallopeptidase [Tenacibaculum holothuriorum]|uniref:M56 family metallopeptidase n=1 Tax=Tenacibaculum holothuriorum TaxID=1635173 RepID=UPI001302B94B|nr:M56 family metallopeptidase [Tenacibaculum holothuriorum]
MHQFNRMYLLLILLVAIIVPNLVISIESPIVNINGISTIENNTFLNSIVPYLFFVYLGVSSLLLIRLIKSLIAIFKQIHNNQQIKEANGTTLVLIEEKILPHTFLKYIFINKEDYLSNKITNELYTHEFTHANQKHTIDVLFAELFQIVFWFNPLSFFITKAIKLNHEFIADESVISIHNNQSAYQNMLLDVATIYNTNILTSNVNYSLTKLRFLMMGKKTSSLLKRIVQVAVIPFLIFVFLLVIDISHSDEHRENGEHNNHIENSTREHQ